MSTSSRPGRINIDLGPYKQPWLDYCLRHRVKPNEAFRRIVAKLIADGAVSANGAIAGCNGSKVRREIRLTSHEVALASAIAHREGYSLNRWLTAVILVRLGTGQQLGQPELEALARSNLLLLAVGRNLNLIARAVNVAAAGPRRMPDQRIAELRTQIADHVNTVALVLARNIERWSTP
jgi:hypothetical protein